MLKKGLAAAALMMICSVSFADRVVVFDAREALLSTKLAQQRFAEVRERPDVAALVKDVERMSDELSAMNQEASRDGLTWSDDKRLEHRKKMEYVQADLKLATQKIQAEQNVVMNELVNELQGKIEVLLGEYVAAQNIDVVLRKESSFLAKPNADITQAIVAELDKAQ